MTNYYEITGDEIDVIVQTAWGLNILGMFLGIYVIGKYKLLIAVRYASVTTLIGGTIRVLSTAFSTELIAPRTQFWLTFAGQVIISLGHPIITTMSTKTSQAWFGERERAISTPLLALAPTLGGEFDRTLKNSVRKKRVKIYFFSFRNSWSSPFPHCYEQ